MTNEPTMDDILNAYCNGIFPMAQIDEDGNEQIGWYDPPLRGVLPLESFHIPRSLKRFIRGHKHEFIITVNTDFDAVIKACGAQEKGREETWISPTIIRWFNTLHSFGFAHSVEFRSADSFALLGGLYGLSLGTAFFGESMFSRTTNASKIALVALVAHLKIRNYTVLDTQFVNDHLSQFGCIEIPKARYISALHKALQRPFTFSDGLDEMEIQGKNTFYMNNDMLIDT